MKWFTYLLRHGIVVALVIGIAIVYVYRQQLFPKFFEQGAGEITVANQVDENPSMQSAKDSSASNDATKTTQKDLPVIVPLEAGKAITSTIDRPAKNVQSTDTSSFSDSHSAKTPEETSENISSMSQATVVSPQKEVAGVSAAGLQQAVKATPSVDDNMADKSADNRVKIDKGNSIEAVKSVKEEQDSTEIVQSSKNIVEPNMVDKSAAGIVKMDKDSPQEVVKPEIAEQDSTEIVQSSKSPVEPNMADKSATGIVKMDKDSPQEAAKPERTEQDSAEIAQRTKRPADPASMASGMIKDPLKSMSGMMQNPGQAMSGMMNPPTSDSHAANDSMNTQIQAAQPGTSSRQTQFAQGSAVVNEQQAPVPPVASSMHRVEVPPQQKYKQIINQARQAYWQGQYQQAVAYYQQAIKFLPELPDGHGELGNIFYEQGEWDKAGENLYQAAIRLLDRGRSDKAYHMLLIIRGLKHERAVELEKRLQSQPSGN